MGGRKADTFRPRATQNGAMNADAFRRIYDYHFGLNARLCTT
ncbi:MAG: hypothetical protein U0838_00115 [Chloroflexota bacterium]